MNRKWLPYLLIVGMAIALFVVRRCNDSRGRTAANSESTSTSQTDKQSKKKSNRGTQSGPGNNADGGADGRSAESNLPSAGSNSTDAVNRDRGFDRRAGFLEYTRHARCRMDCRQISQGEVEEIMNDGSINYSKSDVKARPCPEYAVEGYTSDRQRVRIVFAQCDQKTKVVTVIDLGRDWSCDCPGDDKKRNK